jgi:hypothetical protein
MTSKNVISEKFDKPRTYAQIENIFQKLGRNDRRERDRATVREGNRHLVKERYTMEEVERNTERKREREVYC